MDDIYFKQSIILLGEQTINSMGEVDDREHFLPTSTEDTDPIDDEKEKEEVEEHSVNSEVPPSEPVLPVKQSQVPLQSNPSHFQEPKAFHSKAIHSPDAKQCSQMDQVESSIGRFLIAQQRKCGRFWSATNCER